MTAYHCITVSSLSHVLKDGLKCTSRGEKGDDPSIAKTDYFLDAHRPAKLIEAGISRDNNLYAYVAHGGNVINISDGQEASISTFIHQDDQVVLEIKIDEAKCYVSDLDAFDAVKAAIEKDKNQQTLLELAAEYWSRLQPLAAFSIGDIHRPEIMIPYDVAPSNITIVNK